MSYTTIAQCSRDSAFLDRVNAAVSQEGHSVPPSQDYYWRISGASDIEAAYASAEVGGNPNPGGDESVITDGMILAFVQATPPS